MDEPHLEEIASLVETAGIEEDKAEAEAVAYEPIAAAQSQPFYWLTVERGLIGLCVVLAFTLRYAALGRAPLLPLEAANSWLAWRWAQGLPDVDAAAPASALFFTLQSTLFWLTMGSDVAARLIPATVGSLLVLASWWWRPWLGQWGALVLALVIALDPWLVFFSRLADGAQLSVACAFLALTGLVRLVVVGQSRLELAALDGNAPLPNRTIADARTTGWGKLLGVAGGLLLISGPLAWSFLPVVGAFAFFYRRELVASGLRGHGWLRVAFLAAGLGATGWLARPHGLSLVSASLTAWLDQWQPSGYGAWWVVVRLIADQPLLAVMGVAGLVVMLPIALEIRRLAERENRWERFLWVWALWGVLLMVLPGRNPMSLVVLVWPLIFGVVHLSHWLLRWKPAQPEWRELAIVAATLLILFVSGWFWATALIESRSFEPVRAQALLVIVILTFLVVLLYGGWAGWGSTRWLVSVGVVALLLLSTLARTWELNVEHDAMHPEGIFAVTTEPSIRLLVQDIETLSAHRTGDAHQMPVRVVLRGEPPRAQGGMEVPDKVVIRPDPVVGWYLRKMTNLTWWDEPRGEPSTSPLMVVIGGSAEMEIPAGIPVDEYAGSRYGWRSTWLPERLWPAEVLLAPEQEGMQAWFAAQWSARLQPSLRWLVYRRASVAPEMQEVTLWAPVAR